MSTTDVITAIAELRDAVDRLLGCDLGGLTDAGLLEVARELRPVVCRVQAAETKLIGVVHSRGAVTADGAVSSAAWLRNRLHVDDASVRVRSAMVLNRLPQVAAAFRAGEISQEHVAVIAKVARDITDEAMAAGAERLLVEQARQVPPTKFTQAAVRIRDHLDPEAAERRRRKRLADRWLYASRTFDGAVSVNGMLDPEAGELLLSALGALMPPPAAADVRSAATRRADALLDLCRLAANHARWRVGTRPNADIGINPSMPSFQ